MNGKLRSLVMSGTVLEIGDQHHTVHVHDPSPQHKCYLPSWESRGKPDNNQKLKPKGYQPEKLTFKHADLELITHLTKNMQIPRQAWNQMKAKGVVLPLEYTEQAATVTKQVLTIATRQSARRRPRSARLSMRQDDAQHTWVKAMLREHGMQPHVTARIDHGRLMHYVARG